MSARSLALSLVAVAALTGLSVPGRQAEPPTVVLLVRHAEKEAGQGDVPLSVAGEARARQLAAVAEEAGVDVVITTQFVRTRQTAAPFVAASGVTPEVIAAGADVAAHARATAGVIRDRHRGRTVLVVGHSNTVPPIVNALAAGTGRYRDLCDSEYDALFLVVIGEDGPVRTLRSRFGAPSPQDTACAVMR